MIFSSRRGLYSLLIVITNIFLLTNTGDCLAASGKEINEDSQITAIKTGSMLPFTKLMRMFPSEKHLRNDERIDRFVSKEFPLSQSGYAPKDLELLTGGSLNPAGRVMYLRKEALDALKELARDFEKEFGRPLVVVSGYRSANYQQRLWDLGRCTDTLCAPPGYSEHQLGLSIDIFEATTEEDYLANRAFARYLQWLEKNAHTYGYHQSYQKGESIDAYEIEPWHWRYLGKDFATKLSSLNMSYSQYVEFESMLAFWKRY